MRVLGLDFGARRIGLALSDPDASIASPAGHLERKGGRRDVASLCEFIREHEVGRVVVGLPLHLDGREGEGAQAARRFAAELSERSGLSVELLDERWTTLEAERALGEAGRRSPKKRRKQKGSVDAVAAALILRTFLERGGGDR
ncbi:MAG: Holliday junction resolvase RuvX [Myxococcota bacterium]